MRHGFPACFAEWHHAFTEGELSEFVCRGPALNEFLHAWAHLADFKNRGPAGETCISAMGAADGTADFVGPLEGIAESCKVFDFVFGRFGAVFAKAANESLGNEGPHG